MKNENTKHTPGPWEITQETIDKDWHQITAKGGLVVANVHIGEMPYPLGPSIAAKEANARLIAAAPELLGACESLKSCLENWVEIAGEEDHRDYDSEALEIAREAIAKATGGSS